MELEKHIEAARLRVKAIEADMSRSEVVSNSQMMMGLAREHRRLKEMINQHERIASLKREIEGLHEAEGDPELAGLAAEEIPAKEKELARLERKLMTLLAPEDPADSRNAVLEIRAGTGGEEAALFGADLYKMYMRYFEKKGWKTEMISGHFSDLGGVKELLLSVRGEGVYGILKTESGVHRVQRVPVTEASGRLHTSAATVAVLPEAEEVDIEINPADIRIDTFRSSGPGGQHVNKTESAIRITHYPSGIVVSCQDEKSQLKNRNQAMKVLRSRLLKLKLEEEESKRAAQRRSQVSSGDRSAKIRTYNFPQNRVTDHRVPITIHQLEGVLNGELDLLLEPLAEYFARERLEEILGESE